MANTAGSRERGGDGKDTEGATHKNWGYETVCVSGRENKYRELREDAGKQGDKKGKQLGEQ